MNRQKRSDGQWGTAKRYSVFASRPYEFSPGKHTYTKIRLAQYCRENFISRDQAKTLIKKKWLAVTRFHGCLWVHEICPDQIRQHLGSPP